MPNIIDLQLPGGLVVDRLNDIWNINIGLTNGYSPVSPYEFSYGGIIFLSLNPSFGGHLQRGIELQTYTQVGTPNYHRHHPHFNKFFTLANLCELNVWSCMDLLFVRGMQPDIMKLGYCDFILNQARITIEVIQTLHPCLVVVSNSYAAQILLQNQNRLELDFTRNQYNILNSNEIYYTFDESKYLGSRFLEHNIERRDRLVAAINHIRGYCN